jgi:hypothetical protein
MNPKSKRSRKKELQIRDISKAQANTATKPHNNAKQETKLDKTQQNSTSPT